MTQGRFLVLDGIDGCGKSTQAERLVRRLAEEGPEPLHVREPGSTRLGEALRAILLSREMEMGPAEEALLLTAARRHLLEREVAPALAAGRHAVCERSDPSTFAYQAAAGGLDEAKVLALLEEWARPVRPDLVVVLDLDPELAADRRGSDSDRIEDRGLAFQRKVAEGYRRYAALVPGVVLIDASRDADAVERDVLAEVRRVL